MGGEILWPGAAQIRSAHAAWFILFDKPVASDEVMSKWNDLQGLLLDMTQAGLSNRL